VSLMRIKIPAGYAITYNKFHDVDPIQAEEEDDLLSNWEYFTEDIMQIIRSIMVFWGFQGSKFVQLTGTIVQSDQGANRRGSY